MVWVEEPISHEMHRVLKLTIDTLEVSLPVIEVKIS